MARLPRLLKLALDARWTPGPGVSMPPAAPTLAPAEIAPSGPTPPSVPRITPTGPLVGPSMRRVPLGPLTVVAPVRLLLPESTSVLAPALVRAPEPLIGPANVVRA